ncbi:MAG: ANTAR domain-containing protein, partial [Dermatophilaceae bacterium]|nr:ANTAR domain-containing protein [Dermatophilaceae bacterium]
SDARADASDERARAHEARSDDDRVRLDGLESRADVDRQMIAALQADGTLGRQHAAHLEVALRSSRRIGAAIGIVMAVRRVDEDGAFQVLKEASSHANRKLREIADEVVRTGDVSELPEL